ncbi:cytochrome P450 71A1-like [Papaver somniferum]|uniref:cytochrome P450 71A1-like n=1 Tax=Papaver somniferum TaxID=3469 RepID=UPI000E6F7006|nr:cytochrome P450 71A1-like [Papaver somniferum]XP_026379818.1 cytochrome P450 71A1-like [Papaver somniferum]XP_026379819.1 cytochrome P450 71A1-like [Papaver somniferum]XP_026379820.1 cytochrome P450 71A1-like [Papaver somniferum]XP_026379821.1 cytochrome P450 71A1-like [Papaver somniferum]XP_026379822.1 cytochrome P450 71A1-like [Papaver somniferum]XP_026379823.1 cytochrome P450 71A1-like [Papaver somniferum]
MFIIFLHQLLEQDQVMFLPISLSILTILFFSAILYLFAKLRTKSDDDVSKLNPPPSPPRIPIFGNIHQLGPMLHQSFHNLSSKYGPLILLNLGQKPILVVSSAEMATQICKTNDVIFSNRFSTKASKVIFCGGNDIAIAPYGDYWRKVRKFCVLELLSHKRIQSFKFVREEEVNRVMERINCAASEPGMSINLTEIMFTMLNTIIFRCSLGDNFNKDHVDSFGRLIKKATTLIESMCFEDFFPLLKWVDVLNGFQGKLDRTSQELDNFFNQVFDDHLRSEDQGCKDDKKMNFIDLLLLHAEEDNLSLSRDDIKGIIMDMFVGGSDTTATAVEWSMAELIKNPRLMKKAQEEVRRVVGNRMKVDEQDINQMEYLKCVVKESMRLHPPLPTLIGRVSTAAAKIGDYDIPTNTGVFINAWAIQRDPKLWDKPEEFFPERFRNNPVDFKGQDFEFIPFGSGRRGCPGMAFGIAVVEFLLANLLYHFNWELPGGANCEELDMTEGFGITVNRKIPLHVVPILFHSASS